MNPFRRRQRAPSGDEDGRVAAERGRVLIEESREIVVVLDEKGRVQAASRRARESIEDLREGAPLPEWLANPDDHQPLRVPYEVDGRTETLVYLSEPGDPAAYEELRTGFTAAVSHELRTPLARLMALLEEALLPGADPVETAQRARVEVERARELIDDVLFLSELESGRAVVSLGTTRVRPVLERTIAALAERAARADVRLRVDCDPALELPLRERMLEVVVENLAENAIRYAGPGSAFVLSGMREGGATVLEGADDGAGVPPEDLPRLFERFFRGDRARASRGSGLGLAIVKHVVGAAGGTVDASPLPAGGLRIRCTFPA